MKKSFATILALSALAGVGTTSGATAQPAHQIAQRISDQQKPVEPIVPVSKVNRFSGFEPMQINGYGIPPHIYGMYHVKRGTHKKTNFK